jgi:hypothetical protein
MGGGWIIPANQNVEVPAFFLKYVLELPLQQPTLPHDDNESISKAWSRPYYRVDMYLPDETFKNLCTWLHFNEPAFTCKNFSAIFMKDVMGMWNFPSYPDSDTCDLMNQVVNAWNDIPNALRNSYWVESRIAQQFITELCQLAKKEPEKNTVSKTQTTNNLEKNLGQTFNSILKKIDSNTCNSKKAHLSLCEEAFSLAEQILTIKNTISSGLQCRLDGFYTPKVPAEVVTIAELIAVNKRIPKDTALIYCTKPLDINDVFWKNIESHIGVNSWSILKNLHANGLFDQKTRTFVKFL